MATENKTMNHSEDTVQDKEEKQYYSSIKPMFDKFAKHRDVKLVYGEPITNGKQSIVPVAKMKYSFGAGGGINTEGEDANRGEGGGGHITVNPLGVYEITEDRARFKPVIDVKLIATVCMTLTFGLTLLLRKK